MRAAVWGSVFSSICVGRAHSDEGCELLDAFSSSSAFAPLLSEFLMLAASRSRKKARPLLLQRCYWFLGFQSQGQEQEFFIWRYLLTVLIVEERACLEPDVLRGDRLFTFHNLLGLLPNALWGSKWQSVTQRTFYSGGTYVWCLAVFPGNRSPENNKTWLTTA